MSRKDNEKKRIPPGKFSEKLSEKDMETQKHRLMDLYKAGKTPSDVAAVRVYHCLRIFKKTFE